MYCLLLCHCPLPAAAGGWPPDEAVGALPGGAGGWPPDEAVEEALPGGACCWPPDEAE